MIPYATLGGGPQPTVTLYHGHVTDVLRTLEAGSVHTCITSPPYWGLQSYLDTGHKDKGQEIGSEPRPFCERWERGPRCTQCWVCTMVGVFDEVKRVLRDDGTCWINVGDAYARTGPAPPRRDHSNGHGLETYGTQGYAAACAMPARASTVPAKNLLGLPWRLALALQAAGWWLRQDIIWAKKAPLPESVQDRCTKSHEYLFLLSRHPTYYFDATAIRESASANTHARYAQHGSPHTNGLKHSQSHGGSKPTDWAQEAVEGRNKRSVWHLGPEPSAAAHFATFPQKLVEPCVLAGSSAYGVCSACGAPWRRCVEQVRVPCHGAIDCLTRTKPVDPYDYGSAKTGRWSTVRNTTGWQPTCSCRAGTSRVVVLDPFGGSGTTGLVAAQHGRDAILIDLSAAYLDLAVQRLTPALAQLPLF